MNIQVKFQGDRELISRLKAAPIKARAAMLDGLSKTAAAVHEEAVRSIQTIKGNEVVTRYQPKREHVVSPPGLPPNTDLGRLVASIFFNVNPEQMTAQVGSNLAVAAYLEDGTSKMEARPWLRPAVEKVKRVAKSFFKFKDLV